ncbi:hypothetical protein E5F05_20730 [Deinococcus metallilatus]|uniref:Uncharacterized protein n=1 Tax=Deinococcus metallilatus TaxID=1211322 RepID=A0AAJ5K5V8_9DEIO|nr:hypothetical protein [Deinococcus metallilatus]MBB5294399.1 hypothetical protein [Deinococcus metallilatus]QBY10154.1 hypothetical protein E5F05_20730 [Deinococcus metallilatus]RXJ13880.1 hypothetical protein ERJ73_04380 [Deinococcus metallilatus]TLK29846.1 hypothetical protein FCS05_04695 [Deinococcus metallilatus]GMA15615.1 hypothetical protein GCM10025871_19460 [Deinococcus metallilatus]
MHRTFPLLLCTLLACAPASAAPVSWGSYSTLFSTERTGQTEYRLNAYRVSGRLHILRDVTYRLSFRGGQVRASGKPLKGGCTSGVLKKGEVLLFHRATRVELQIPSPGCGQKQPTSRNR